jgi:hypothetical protein
MGEMTKEELIQRYKTLCQLFAERQVSAFAVASDEVADRLHEEYGLTYPELIDMELAAWMETVT